MDLLKEDPFQEGIDSLEQRIDEIFEFDDQLEYKSDTALVSRIDISNINEMYDTIQRKATFANADFIDASFVDIDLSKTNFLPSDEISSSRKGLISFS